MKLKVNINMKPNWEMTTEKQINLGLLEMANDVRTRAIVLAPKASRALVNSGVVNPVSKGYEIKFGSSRVPYARRRHFENKKNPSTIGYLSKAAESVFRGNITKYFKGKV